MHSASGHSHTTTPFPNPKHFPFLPYHHGLLLQLPSFFSSISLPSQLTPWWLTHHAFTPLAPMWLPFCQEIRYLSGAKRRGNVAVESCHYSQHLKSQIDSFKSLVAGAHLWAVATLVTWIDAGVFGAPPNVANCSREMGPRLFSGKCRLVNSYNLARSNWGKLEKVQEVVEFLLGKIHPKWNSGHWEGLGTCEID